MASLSSTGAFIHIDTSLNASRYRWVAWLAVSGLITAMLGLLPLAVSVRVALALLVIVCLVVSQLSSHQLLAVSTTPANRKRRNQQPHSLLSDYDWQIQCVQGYFFMPVGQTTDIYQAKLQAVIDMGAAVIIVFKVFEPFDKTLQFVIWCDQVDSDTWRQLKVIAHQ